MAANDMTGSQSDQCRRAIEAAMGVALEHCTGEEDIKTQLGGMLGVEPDVDCQAAVNEGLNQQTCEDFEGLRQWVMCNAWNKIQNEDMSFSDAVDESWNEAKSQCSNMGVSV